MRLGIGTFELDVDLTVEAGEVVAVLGPNGAGKTSLLRGLAGLLPLNAGRVVLDGVVLEEPAAGVFVAPERRPIGMVFQDYLLFPHLSVLDNVAFGLRSRGTATVPANRAALNWLERVGLAGDSQRKPGSLSGGQAQRVALARALATSPALLLLDEPMAALDVSTRVELRRDLRRHLESFRGVRLLVTHDPVEALAMADRLVILEQGRVLQSGSPAEVTQHPRSRYVADLVGVNLFRGRATNNLIAISHGGRSRRWRGVRGGPSPHRRAISHAPGWHAAQCLARPSRRPRSAGRSRARPGGGTTGDRGGGHAGSDQRARARPRRPSVDQRQGNRDRRLPRLDDHLGGP